MIKLVLPAAVAAIALGTVVAAPLAVQAQTVQPMQQPSPYTTDVNATVGVQAEPGYDVAPPMGYPAQPAPYAQQPMSPRTTWIPGHYNWDPATSNYAWTAGQYMEAPTTTAQWIPGHWAETPTAWIWINGGWR